MKQIRTKKVAVFVHDTKPNNILGIARCCLCRATLPVASSESSAATVEGHLRAFHPAALTTSELQQTPRGNRAVEFFVAVT